MKAVGRAGGATARAVALTSWIVRALGIASVLLFPAQVAAGDTLELDGSGRYPLESHMSVLMDRSSQLDIAGVKAAWSRGEFESLPGRGANFGYTASTVWLRFTVEADSGNAGSYVVEVPYAPLDRAVLHAPNARNPVQRRQFAGDRLPFRERSLVYRMPAFSIDLAPGERQTIYLEVASQGAVQAPAILWDKGAFQNATRKSGYLLGPYFGIATAMALYNLLLFASLRDRNYLYYVGSITTIALFAFVYNGLAFQFIWPGSPELNEVALPFITALGGFALIQFSRSFLSLRSFSPSAERCLQGLQVVALFIMLGVFVLPYRWVALPVTVYIFVLMLAIFGSALTCWLRGERRARYFVIGWSVFLVGACVFTLSLQGLLPANPVTRNAVQVGSAIEMILLAFALADRMRLLQQENERIRTEATRRLLRDLHDGMGRHFVKLLRDVDNTRVSRRHLRADLRRAFTDMRLLVSTGGPHFRDLLSGLITIREQFDPLFQDHGIAWNWEVSLDSRATNNSPDRTLNALRIVQEALTNVVKYTTASEVTLRAFGQPDRSIVIEIMDDGPGIEDPGRNTGGLANMRARAREYGIDLWIGNGYPGIRMRIPTV